MAEAPRPATPPGPGEKAIVHTSQLPETMRRGDPKAQAGDRGRKAGLDLLIVLALALLVAVVIGKVGIGLSLDVAVQTYLLALSTAVLTGASYLFNTIRWKALRGPQGARVLNKARADLVLTSVSILALFTVVVMVVVEAAALLVFVGVVEKVGSAGAAFAGNFVLFQTIMLLVYLLALVVRETNVSTYDPEAKAVTAAKVLSPLALLFVAAGAFLATGLVQVAGIEVHQAVYVVTLGVLLEFMAMRIRLRLPSLWSRFQAAVDVARRANEEVKDSLRKRALRTYVIASVFVAASMAFAGAIATGAVSAGSTRTTLSLVIFYVGFSLILLGVVAVRMFQSRLLRAPAGVEGDELAALVQQKRKTPEEVFRQAVYGITGLIAFVCLMLTLLTGMGNLPFHPKYATDFFILATLFGAGPFGFFYNREAKRILAIDEKFPDFLRDLAESARAGMTLPRAMVTASQGTYGALTPDIQKMAAQVEWGIEFSEALERFSERTRTPLINRTVSLVVEAQRAGGNVVDILTAASEDAREIKQIISERNTQMSMYTVVIYIAYFVFISVVLVLSAQFIPAFKEAVGAAAGAQVGGLQFKDFDPEDFNTAFFHAALAQAIGGGLVGGVLSRGSPIAGFMHIGIMMVVAWISFRILVGAM